MNNLKQKLVKMNPKKGFCNLILCFVIFFIIAGIGTIAKLSTRMPEIRHQIQIREYVNIATTSDYVFIGCVIAVFWIILSIYWLYTTAYAMSKSWEVGANAWIFGGLTFFTNIVGVACLWIYIKLHLVCPECGKLQPIKANNCALCGAPIYVRCPDCSSRVSIKDAYCNGCGRKMNNR